ncbi:MAG: hypothetical protein C5B53_05600 [Candidatus Melainabacteria bacterium]|nr:MAG: hypothetical protein C5B53_05600 [Candidatus Melainabacteria bacterium]
MFAISLLILFAEVMSIRWMGSEIPLLRIFPNLILMTTFIGVSIGLATSERPFVPPGTMIIAVVGIVLTLAFATPLQIRHLTLIDHLFICVLLLGFLIFNLNVIFISLGRVLGREFATLPALKAYSFNLLGSLAGVIAFGVGSWLWLPPAVWLLVTTLLGFFLSNKKLVLYLGAALIALIAFVYRDSTWSPYGNIRIVPLHEFDTTPLGTGNYSLLSNGDYYHEGVRILPVKSLSEIETLYKPCGKKARSFRTWLEVPFLVASKWDKVLILGGGSGDDVQAALIHDAKHVDTVEIDPFIASCGRLRHPERPYLNEKVNVFVEDARTFLRYDKDKYDLIQFAYLDPGQALRITSFLRTDNYVYTKESIKSALDRLSPEGIISLSFATGGDSPVTRRLYKTITEVWGKPPLAFIQEHTGAWDSCFFFFGPGLKNLPPETVAQAGLRPYPGKGEYFDTRTAEDDWPFLYIDFNVGAIYIYVLTLLSAMVLPLQLLRKGLSGKLYPLEVMPMFFLGLAFMLMETKSIIALSLLYGSTWLVNSVVIGVILLLAFLANLLSDRFQLKRLAPWYFCLTLSLLLDYFFRIPAYSEQHPLWLSFLAAIICCLPVFFSGIIFSTLFKRSSNPVMSLAANIIGAAFGGLLENLCILTGVKSLSLLALALYLLSGLPLLFLATKPEIEKIRPEPSN